MSDAGFLANVGVRINDENVGRFEQEVLRAMRTIAAEAERRVQGGESLAGISTQFQQVQRGAAEQLGSADISAAARRSLTTVFTTAMQDAIRSIQASFTEAGVGGAAGFRPVSKTGFIAQADSARTQQAALDAERRAAAAAEARRFAQEQARASAPSDIAINKQMQAEDLRALAVNTEYLEATAELARARNRLAAAESVALNNPQNVSAAANAELARQRLQVAERSAVAAGTTTGDVSSQANLRLNEARIRVAEQLLVEERTLAADNQRLGQLAAARARNATAQGLAQIASTTPADLAARAQLAAENQVRSAQAQLDQIAAARGLGDGERSYTEILGAARAAREAETAAVRRSTQQQLANNPSFVADTAAANRLRELTGQRVKLAELGLREISGETVAQTSARIAVEQQAKVNRQRLAEIEALRGSSAEEAALIVQRQLAEKALNREINARVQQEIRSRVNSGQLAAGTLFQQVQASIATRQGGTPRLPTDYATLGQTVASRFATTAGFAISGLGTYGALAALKDIYKSEQDVQQEFTIIQGQLNALGEGRSLSRVRNDIAGVAADTGTAEASLARIFPQIEGAFHDTAVALADARTAAEFAKITRTDLQATADALVPASVAFGVTFQEITDRAFGIQERAGVSASKVVQVFGALGPVARQAGLDLQSVGAIAAAVLQDTTRTPQTIAEDFNRLIPQLQTNAQKIAAVLQQSGAAADAPKFIEDIIAGRTGAAIELLIRDYQKLSPAQQEVLEASAGSTRGAKDLIDLFLNQKVALGELNPALTDAGKTQKYFSDLSKDLGQQLARAREELLQFGRALLESGVVDGFQDLLTILTAMLSVLKTVGEFFVFLNDHSGNLAGRLLEVAAAAKILQVTLAAIEARGLGGALTGIAGRIPGLRNIVGGGGEGGAQFAASVTEAATTHAAEVTGAAATFAATITEAAAVAAAELQAGAGAAAGELGAGGAVGGFERSASGLLVPAEAAAARSAGAGTAAAIGAEETVPVTGGLSLIPLALIAVGLSVKSEADKLQREGTRYRQSLQQVTENQLATAARQDPSLGERIASAIFAAPTQAQIAQGVQRARQAQQSGLQSTLQAAAASNVGSPGGRAPFDDLLRNTLNDPRYANNPRAAQAKTEELQRYIATALRPGGRGFPDLVKAINDGNETAIQVAQVVVDQLKGRPDLAPELEAAKKKLEDAASNAKDPKTGVSPNDALQASAQQAIDNFTAGTGSLIDALSTLHTSIALATGQAKDKLEQQLQKLTSDTLAQDVELSESLSQGSSSDLRDTIGREVQLFNLPEFTDRAARLTLAKKIVSNLHAQLAAEAQAATSTAERNRILQAGLALPSGVASVLATEQVDLDPLIQNFFAQIRNIDNTIFAGVRSRTIALVAADKSDREATIQAMQEAIDELTREAGTLGSENPEAGGQLAAEIQALQAQLDAYRKQPGLNLPAIGSTVTNAPPTGTSTADTEAELRRARAALQTALAGRDPVAAAQIAQQLAQDDLDAAVAAGDELKILQARTELAQANQQLDAAYAQIGQAMDQFRAALDSTDPVTAARDALALANDQLDAARQANDTVAMINAQVAQITAQRALTKAVQDVGLSQLELIKAQLSAAGDVVGAAREQVSIIQQEIADAIGRGAGTAELNGLYAQLTTAQADVGRTQISFTEQQIQDNLDLKRITLAQAVQQLRALEAVATTQAARDEIEKRVRQLLSSTDQSYNLPAGIILPTLYEVKRTAASGGLSSYQDNRQIAVQVDINNDWDEAKVSAFLSELFTGNSQVLTTATRSYP